MVGKLTEEEKRLSEIFEPYFNYKTCQLFEDAPNEAVEALKQFRKIGKEYTNPDNI